MNGPYFLGAEIRALRLRRDLKQYELADRLGIDASVLGLWEQNKRPVPLLRIETLERVLEHDFGMDTERPVLPASEPLLRQVPVAVRAAMAAETAQQTNAVLLGRCADPLCGDPTCQRWRLPCGCYVLIRQGEPLTCRHSEEQAA